MTFLAKDREDFIDWLSVVLSKYACSPVPAGKIGIRILSTTSAFACKTP
jgi:hypothetical protein